MRKYLLPENANSYKANLHTHSTFSDGDLTPEELKAIYMEKGYSILSYTDHDVFITHNHLTDDSFLVLNGYELDVAQPNKEVSSVTGCRKTCHFGLIATSAEMETPVCWHREKYIPPKALPSKPLVKFDPSVPDYERAYSAERISDMMRLGRENGFFVIYNHPTWSCEDYSDYIAYENMHAMEIMNYGCIRAGFPEYNERVYDDMLRSGKRILCIGADDAHGTLTVGGCYIVVKAQRLEYKTVMDAIMRGDFYSSEGPEIKALYVEDGKVTIETSEVEEIRFNTGVRRCERFVSSSKPITSATYELPDNVDPVYLRVTITDKDRKVAYTNAYFSDEWAK